MVYRDDRESLRLRIAALERQLEEARRVGDARETELRALDDEIVRLTKLWEMHSPETRRLWPWLLAAVVTLAALGFWLRISGMR